MAKGGFDNESPSFHWHLDHDDDYDDDEQEVNRTRPFQLDTTSTPYHPGEQIEMLKFPEEQSGLPGTIFAEDKPLIGGFFTKTTNEQYLTEQERLSKEDFRKSASPNLDQSALTKKEMKLKWLRLGQRAASPTFSRKTIGASCDHSKIESKMLLAQKPKIIAEDNKSIREKKTTITRGGKTTTREGKNCRRSPTSQ